MDGSGKNSEDHILLGTSSIKIRSTRFHMGMRTLLEMGIEATCISFWLGNFLPFVCVLRLFRRMILRVKNYSSGGISRKPTVQAVIGVLLAAFNQIYSENQEENEKLNDLQNLQFHQRGSICDVLGKREHVD